jgi:hypothetical protein
MVLQVLLVLQDPTAQQVPLALLAHKEHRAQLVLLDHRVFKAFKVLLVLQAHKARWVQLVLLEPLVLPEQTEQWVPQVPQEIPVL